MSPPTIPLVTTIGVRNIVGSTVPNVTTIDAPKEFNAQAIVIAALVLAFLVLCTPFLGIWYCRAPPLTSKPKVVTPRFKPPYNIRKKVQIKEAEVDIGGPNNNAITWVDERIHDDMPIHPRNLNHALADAVYDAAIPAGSLNSALARAHENIESTLPFSPTMRMPFSSLAAKDVAGPAPPSSLAVQPISPRPQPSHHAISETGYPNGVSPLRSQAALDALRMTILGQSDQHHRKMSHIAPSPHHGRADVESYRDLLATRFDHLQQPDFAQSNANIGVSLSVPPLNQGASTPPRQPPFPCSTPSHPLPPPRPHTPPRRVEGQTGGQGTGLVRSPASPAERVNVVIWNF